MLSLSLGGCEDVSARAPAPSRRTSCSPSSDHCATRATTARNAARAPSLGRARHHRRRDGPERQARAFQTVLAHQPIDPSRPGDTTVLEPQTTPCSPSQSTLSSTALADIPSSLSSTAQLRTAAARSRPAARTAARRLELAAGAGIEVDVGGDEGDERQRERVDDAGDDVQQRKGMLETKISTTPRSGPAASAMPALTPTSEPVRIQRRGRGPRFVAGADAVPILELDGRSEQAPADGEPDRHRDQERGRRERTQTSTKRAIERSSGRSRRSAIR